MQVQRQTVRGVRYLPYGSWDKLQPPAALDWIWMDRQMNGLMDGMPKPKC